jgi:phosphinothricin acetyltransferase
MNAAVRDATAADLDAINAIYNHYIEHSAATYQTMPITPQQRLDWWQQHQGRFPVLVVTDAQKKCIGWASLSEHSGRSGYRFTVQNSIYLHKDFCRQGLGKPLLAELIQRGRDAGFHTIVALIESSQTASLKLHGKAGFREAGRLVQVGFKFERWLDTVYMQLML